MKIIAIVLTALIIIALIAFFVLLINAHDLIYCGDIASGDNATKFITRIYTADFDANNTLSQIVNAMNNSEEDVLTTDELTVILAEYQNIIYAPVFAVSLEQADESTYILSGSIYNGLDETGAAIEPDFRFDDLTLTVGVENAVILAAQNVYPDEEDTDKSFKERKKVVDPVIIEDRTGAAFAFRDCNSFRLVFTETSPDFAGSVTLAFTYNINAKNPLNFTGAGNEILAFTLGVAYDDKGVLAPDLTIEHKIYTIED